MKAYRVDNAREIRQVGKNTFEKIFLGPSQPYDNCGCHTLWLVLYIPSNKNIFTILVFQVVLQPETQRMNV